MGLGWILEAHWMLPGKLTIHMLLTASQKQFYKVQQMTSNISQNQVLPKRASISLQQIICSITCTTIEVN